MQSQNIGFAQTAIGSLIPIGKLAESTPYSADFLRQLARAGKIEAHKVSRDWMTTPEAVRKYIKRQQARHQKQLAELDLAERSLS